MLGHRTLAPEDYLNILKRRWWIIVVPLLVLPIVAVAFSYLIPPRYMSQTLVLIEGQKVPDSYVKSVVTEDLDSRLASMREQILSRSHLQPIIERYNLYGTQHLDLDDRIDLVRKDIDIKPIHSDVARSGGLPGFFIAFKADDARTAQLVCSDITSLFVNENIRVRAESAEGTTDFIKAQLEDKKRNLDEQDAKLAAFQRQYIGRLPGQENTNSEMLTSLNTQLEAATQQLTRMEQDRSYVQAMLAQQGQASVPTKDGSSVTPTHTVSPEMEIQLQSLLAQESELTAHYTSDYPDVVAVRRKIADLRRQMAASPSTSSSGSTSMAVRESPAVQQLRAQLKAEELGIQEKRKEQAQFESNIRQYQGRIESSPMVEEQYKQLTRDYQTAQSIYDDLLNKMNQSKMATDLEKRQEGEQFKVMDEANLPDAPFSPKRAVFLASGGGFGIILGLAIAALLEYRDTSLRSERDVWAFTKLPTLGLIGFSSVMPQRTNDKDDKPRWWKFRLKKQRQVAGAQGHV